MYEISYPRSQRMLESSWLYHISLQNSVFQYFPLKSDIICQGDGMFLWKITSSWPCVGWLGNSGLCNPTCVLNRIATRKCRKRLGYFNMKCWQSQFNRNNSDALSVEVYINHLRNGCLYMHQGYILVYSSPVKSDLCQQKMVCDIWQSQIVYNIHFPLNISIH